MAIQKMLAVAAAFGVAAVSAAAPVFSTTCNDKPYTYNEMAGFGFVASDAVDKFGDTISMGSSISIKDWQIKGNKYTGTFWALPDRGWNTNGTIAFISRVHKFAVELTLAPNATKEQPSPPNVAFKYLDTILLKDPAGNNVLGLDADQSGGLQFPGFPVLPTSTYTGDGFGGAGPGGKAAVIDAEGLVVNDDGTFWVSDEYGPYIYKFDKDGKMTQAIAPPDAMLPLRQGQVSFASNNPPSYNPAKIPVPADPTQGRQNNQGLEGLTISADGKKLYALLQSAARQEGGSQAATRRPTRFLQYDISGSGAPKYEAEYAVVLPTYVNSANQTRVAAQSEVHAVGDGQFFVLPRDSSAGASFPDTMSRYRHIDVFDIAPATNLAGPTYDAFNASIANSTTGALKPGVTPATFCPFLDVNVNDQLNRFGLHNGGAQDAGLLNEKWESIALLPAYKASCRTSRDPEYLLFVASDNDFITQNGFINGGKIPYKDASGFSLNNQVLVFRVTLGKGAVPYIG